MSRTIVTISASTPVLDAWQLMEQSRFRSLPVIDSAGKYIGMLAYSPNYLALQNEENVLDSWQFILALTEATAGDHVCTTSPTITLNTPVVEAAALMKSTGHDALPVVENGTLVGMLSLENTFQMAVQQKRPTDQLVD